MEAIPIALNWGSLGLLAIAVFTVIQGLWIPKILHDKMLEHQKAGYEAVIAQYKAADEEKSKEILRLRTRNEEVVLVAMNQASGTTAMIEALRLALAKGNYLPGPEADERRAS
jgi:hypothetical protein